MSSITDWLDYTPRGTGVRSRGYRVQVSPNSGSTASPGDTVRFDIPAGRGRSSFIDPSQTTIQFVIKSTADTTNGITIDGSFYTFLNRFTLLSSGQVLEDVADYNHAIQTFLDLQVQGADMAGSGSVMIGAASDSDKLVNKLGYGFSSAAADYSEACLPLHLSGILGTACPKLLPVGMLQDLRAEFVIEAALNIGVTVGTQAYSLQSIVMNLFYVDLDPVVADQLYAQNAGTYRISTECWRSYQYTPGSANSADSVMIPARFSSVKSFFTTWRPSEARAVKDKYWISARMNPFYSSTAVKGSAQYAVGSLLFPNTPLTFGIAEMFASMLQSFHSQANANMNSRCNRSNWITNTNSTDAQAMGTFALGVNTENLCYKSKSFTTGTNTLTSPVVLNVSYPAQIAKAPVITTICHFDAICEISDSGVAMRF